MDEFMRKGELIKAMTAVELPPMAVDSEISQRSRSQIPLSKLAALGTGMEPIAAAVQQIVSHGQAVSGYYKVTIPPGTHLAQFANSPDFLGTALTDATNAIQNQAHLTPLMCNPTMLFVAATLFSIDQKLDAMQETQREMLDFIVQRQKSELKGDLDFLIGVFNHYKYNWNNEKYKSANHVKVLDIRQEAGARWIFTGNRSKSILISGDFCTVTKMCESSLSRYRTNFRTISWPSISTDLPISWRCCCRRTLNLRT